MGAGSGERDCGGELERRSERLPCQGLAGKETVGPGSWGMALAKAREWRGWTQFLRHF